MQKQQFTLINKLGLHARPAMQLINLTGRFQCQIHMNINGRTIDAKDMLQVMGLGAKCGTVLEFTADGTDETEALQAIGKLIADRFGESE